MNSSNDTIRIAIYIDGGFQRVIRNHFLYHSNRKAPIDIKGLEGLVRHSIAKRKVVAMAKTAISLRRYCSGQFSAAEAKEHGEEVLEKERNWEQKLRSLGYEVRFSTMQEGREKGVDVYLALKMHADAIDDRFDCAVLISGDGDFVPLAEEIRGLGKEFVVPDWDCRPPEGSPQKTSKALIAASSWAIDIMRMIDRPDDDDRMFVDGLFLKVNEERPQPVEATLKTVQPIPERPNAGDGYSGVVTFWNSSETAVGYGWARLTDSQLLPCGAKLNAVYLLLNKMIGGDSPPRRGDVIRIHSIAPNLRDGHQGKLFAQSYSIERRAETQAAA